MDAYSVEGDGFIKKLKDETSAFLCKYLLFYILNDEV